MQFAERAARSRAVAGWRSCVVLARRLERVRPAYVLAPLVVVQLLATVALALTRPHNGWLFYHGGDATEYWSHEWAIAHGFVPRALLGYVIPLLYGWVPVVTGETLLSGLPVIVTLQVLVLVPLTVVLVFAVATRLAGRLLGYVAVVAWIVVPFAVIPLFRIDYRPRYSEQFLPQAFGLVNLGDFPSLVLVTAGAYLVFRTLDTGRLNDALAAGLVMGLAIGTKPSNALVLPAAPIVLLLARRWREALTFGVALVPALLTLALWKHKGYGTIPLLTLPEAHAAAGTSLPGLDRATSYVDFSWSHLEANRAQLREFFWSRLLVEWVAVAGAYAAIRRSPLKGIYVVLWFVAFYVVKGGSQAADLTQATFWRLTMPGFPAFLLLAASLVLLVPGWGRTERRPRPPWTPLRRTRMLVVAIVGAAALPLAAVAALPPADVARIARDNVSVNEMPISPDFEVHATRAKDGVRLTWDKPPSADSKVFYLAFRVPGSGDGCSSFTEGAAGCILAMPFIGRTALTKLVDSPLPGRYTWRIGMAAAPVAEDADRGDMMLLSPPVSFDVRCTTKKCVRDVARLRAAG
jgi:hypothetical protein